VCVCAFSLRRESPNMILGDKPLIFEVVLSHLSSQIPSKGVGPNFLEEMISHVFPRSKFFFPRKVSFFVGYILNWIIIPFLLVSNLPNF
jgi:hypothetical protein